MTLNISNSEWMVICGKEGYLRDGLVSGVESDSTDDILMMGELEEMSDGGDGGSRLRLRRNV
jgi:hypothetical protein